MDLYKLFIILQKLWRSNTFVRFGIITTVAMLFRHFIYMKIYRKRNKFPNGPNGIPVFGTALHAKLIGFCAYQLNILSKYGPVVSYPSMMQQVCAIQDPEVARQIYSNPNTWNRYEPFLHNVANTVTFLNGEKWLSRRKNIHSNLIATINSATVTKGSIEFLNNVLFPYLDKKQQITNTKDTLRPLTFNLVFFACVGKHIRSLNDEFFVEFDKLATEFMNNFRKRFLIAFLIGNGFLYNLIFKRMFRLTELGENIRKRMVKLVVEYDAKHQNNNSISSERKCFVDYMKETKTLTNEELFSDVASLLFPSIDTTSSVLGFCLLLLCKYPIKVQKFIYEKELKPVFNGNVDNIQLSQEMLNKIPYFRAFIHETLRIYPPATTTAVRFLPYDAEPIKIGMDSNESYEINSNTVFVINTVGIGRNPAFWVKNKDKINNVNMKEIHFDFWIDENGLFKQNKSLTTFSMGRRECLGKQVALRNMYVVLAALMLRYKFSVEDYVHWEIPEIDDVLITPGNAKISVIKR
eukprot:325880_1